MKRTVLDRILGLTIVVGAVAVLKEFFNYIRGKGNRYYLADFDELIKGQKTVDELNAREIVGWIQETKKSTSEELTYILAYPTQEVISRYSLKDFPDDIDREHNMIFLAIRKNTYMPVKIQLISFGTVNEELVNELFKGGDYAVVEE